MAEELLRFDIKNIARSQEALERIEKGLRPKAMRAGIVAASRPVKERMKELSPIMEGYLKDSIGHRSFDAAAASSVVGSLSGSIVVVGVGSTRKAPAGPNAGRKAIWHQYGTVKMAATPFLSDGFDQASGEFEKLYFGGLERYIKRVTR